jgi:hypothetical protein
MKIGLLIYVRNATFDVISVKRDRMLDALHANCKTIGSWSISHASAKKGLLLRLDNLYV